MERIRLTICGGLMIILAIAIRGGHSQTGTVGVAEPAPEAEPDATTLADSASTPVTPTGPSKPTRIPTPPSFNNDTEDTSDNTTSASQPAIPEDGNTTLAASTASESDDGTTQVPEDFTDTSDFTDPMDTNLTEADGTENATTERVATEAPKVANTTDIEAITDGENLTEATTAQQIDVPTTTEMAKMNITELDLPNENMTTAETLVNVTEPTSSLNTTAVDDVTTVAPVPVDDPCKNPEQGVGIYYLEKRPEGIGACFEGFNISIGTWYRFLIDNESAEIPLEPIKQGYCGVTLPFRMRNTSLPAVGITQEAQVCTLLTGQYTDPDAHRKSIDIHHCKGGFYLYRFKEPLATETICKADGGSAICLKKTNEVVDEDLIYTEDSPTTSPATTAAPETTAIPKPPLLPSIPTSDMTEEEENGTVTEEFKDPKDEADKTKDNNGRRKRRSLPDEKNFTQQWAQERDENFRTSIAKMVTSYKCGNVKPLEQTTAAIEETTVGKVAETTKTIVRYTWFTTGKIATLGETTLKTTTTTTPASLESNDLIELVTSDSDPNEENAQATAPSRVGVKIEDNYDPDSGLGPGARMKRMDASASSAECDGGYTKDDVFYVYDTPMVSDGVFQVAIVVIKGGLSSSNRTRRAVEGSNGKVLPGDDLHKAIEAADKEEQEKELGLAYVKHYRGAPVKPEKPDVVPPPGPDKQETMWEAHMGLFIAIIILIILCLIVVIIGILCIKCKGKKSSPEKTPLRAEEGQSPTVIENPIPDEEIVRGEAPMTEAYNPAYTPNGSGHHLTKGDEDNGWIVPLDELTYAERERPEVDNTRL